eukprot:6952695-Pyramimonas_sp.AAC.1
MLGGWRQTAPASLLGHSASLRRDERSCQTYSHTWLMHRRSHACPTITIHDCIHLYCLLTFSCNIN